MSESNRSYRIRTDISKDKNINVQINNDYDILEILSLKISTENVYKLHTSHYGCVVGRVLANGGVGVPNAKISIFIAVDEETSEDTVLYNLYPYSTTSTKNGDGIRYNLLPDEQVSMCHQAVGTMPNKRLVLDDKNTLEIFDKYYKYTTVTNNAGDYMIFGVPVGNQSIHMDVDLSDIGFLSQKPIDMLYKGYNITQFENAQQFKKDTNLNNLSQIISQNTNVFVNPFWGDEGESEISITRHDIDVDYKFEPTCIFMGSLVTDNTSNGFSKRCVPTPNMGRMDRLTTGSGTIEMIRKKSDGTVEEYAVSGTQLIDGNGTWCYQIPMNLDYVTTDEYGNIVPTDNPEKGLPTRTRVRFRISLGDFDSDYSNNHLVKVLVPNNPQEKSDLDYVYGTDTQDDEGGTKSFRDLFWNNVYTVKSYIPRIQKGNFQRTKKFSGIKNVNVYGNNNPIPYNNMRVNITFMFTLQCAIIKALLLIVRIINKFIVAFDKNNDSGSNNKFSAGCITIGDGLCPDLEGWYFAPGCSNNNDDTDPDINALERTLNSIKEKDGLYSESNDLKNSDGATYCITCNSRYLLQCIEINLAMENEVIQFDFYNDWINGLLYIPRWFVKIKKKASFLFGLIKIKPKVKACMEDSFFQTRRFTQQCALEYIKTDGSDNIYSTNVTRIGCKNDRKEKCHKSHGRKFVKIFGGKNGGIIHNEMTYKGQSVYYAKPCEWNDGKKCNFFATDIVLLGSISNNNLWGIPNEFDGMQSSTFQMPPNLVQTNMDSDGVLYGIADGSNVCDKTKIVDKDGKANPPEVKDQTFDDFKKWVADVNEIPNDDVDEYAVTEISGIDWGFSGPNQGKSEEHKLFKPGGHFLGIACTNAEVNIKSCVNLSRICELGALMSQRQSELKVINESNNEYGYEYIIPSGLISKLEISDTNYRTIFATLNQNKLKSVVNHDGTRKYDFISIQPINFNGDLFVSINGNGGCGDLFNKRKRDNNNESGPYAYFKTIEDNSEDYYYFRLGINKNTKSKDVKNKYLINNGNNVAMPVFENSFYFYYGLKNGDTAMDKFLTNYYAQCPKPIYINEPHLEVIVEPVELCAKKTYDKKDYTPINSDVELDISTSYILFNVENIPLPYEISIIKSGSIIYHNSIVVTNKCYIKNLKSGNYTLVVKNEKEGFEISKSFVIDEYLPEYGTNLSTNNFIIRTYDFTLKPEYSIIEETEDTVKLDIKYFIETDKTNVMLLSNISVYDDEDLDPPYVYAIVVESDEYYSYKSLCGVLNDDDIKKIKEFYSSKKELQNEDIINFNESETSGNISLWDVGTYEVSIIYSCSKKSNDVRIFNKYNIGSYFIGDSVNRYEYYIHDENLLLNDISRVLTGTTSNVYSVMFDENKLKEYENDPNVWKIKKEIIYDTPISELQPKTINVGVINAQTPYKVSITGTTEIVDEYGKIILNSTTDEINSLDDILIPTEPWMVSEEIEFGGVISDKTEVNNKMNYIFDVSDSSGYHPIIILNNDNNGCSDDGCVYDYVCSDDGCVYDCEYECPENMCPIDNYGCECDDDYGCDTDGTDCDIDCDVDCDTDGTDCDIDCDVDCDTDCGCDGPDNECTSEDCYSDGSCDDCPMDMVCIDDNQCPLHCEFE